MDIIICILLLYISIFLTWYHLTKDNKNIDETDDTLQKLSFSEIQNLIDTMVSFNSLVLIEKKGLHTMSEAKLNSMFDDLIIEVSAKTLLYIGSDVKEQFYKYASDEYLKIYINRSSQILLIYNITQKKKNLKDMVTT